MTLSPRLSTCALLAVLTGWSATVKEIQIGSSAGEESCILTNRDTSFPASTRQVFARLVANNVRPTDSLTVDFFSPTGLLVSSIPYEHLPVSGQLCLLSQLPIAGFPAAQSPGAWTIRVSLNGTPAATANFVIRPDEAAVKGLQISRITLDQSATATKLTVDGAGFNTESILHVAQYEKSGGWRYLVHNFPETLAATRATLTLGVLQPGEYVVFVKNGNLLSAPARFLIATTGGYRLPFPPHEQWVISQPPYGGYSHWGATLHAYDIAPRAGGCIVAMRGGIVHTKDLGLGQTPNRRIFGNSISIDHEDGEFSHYGHLKTRSYLVREGQRVLQGQPLAIAGNSGYSFGTHVHVQVTRAPSISSASVPFRFQELAPAHATGYRGPVVSTNRSGLGDCSGPPKPGDMPIFTQATPRGKTPMPPPPDFTGAVSVASWWNQFVAVPNGSAALDIRLDWDAADRDLDLHLVSPSGRHYGSSYGDRTGYTETAGVEESFHINNPEPGTWRVSVQGIKGNGEPMPFRVYRRLEPAASAWGGARRK